MKLKQIILMLFYVATATAQQFQLGKVSMAELAEKAHPKVPTAVAAILFDTGEVRFDFSQKEGIRMILTVKKRIKIYSKEGLKWANESVRCYKGNHSQEQVVFSDATTYNLVDGAIVKTKLKKEGDIEQNINKYWSERKITLPNVSEGSVIEYAYSIVSPDIGSFRDWDFQTSIPVNYSEFKSYIPEYFIYNVSFRGFFSPQIKTEQRSRSFGYNDTQQYVPAQFQMYATSQEKFDFNENVTTYTAQEMPAIDQEAFVGNIQNYTSGVAFELSATRFPNRPMKSYSTDWESLVQTIGKFDDFGAELNRTGYFETDVDALLSAATDDADKIARLFGFIKNHMNWNQYNDFRCDKGVRAAYKDKTGNAAEINLMLTASLRYAGLDANPVLISTRSNGIFHFPNLMAFNYVIVAVETPNGQLLLDATEKMATPNVLPMRDLNGIGRLIRRDGSSAAIDLMPKSLSREIDFLDFTVTADGMASGKIRSQLTNHKALEFRKKGSPGEKQLYVEELENRFNGIEIEDYARENDTDLYKPIVENYSFNDKRTPEIVNGKIYISPLLFLAMKNPLQADTRNYPVEFDCPFGNKYHITIEIPSGYMVESTPAPINLIAAEGIGTFKYLIATVANKIQLTVTFEVNWPTVPATQYETLKKFWQQAADKENEKIVLVKKTL